jgi:hypothetical protein
MDRSSFPMDKLQLLARLRTDDYFTCLFLRLLIQLQTTIVLVLPCDYPFLHCLVISFHCSSHVHARHVDSYLRVSFTQTLLRLLIVNST